jgi:hypothetical protein
VTLTDELVEPVIDDGRRGRRIRLGILLTLLLSAGVVAATVTLPEDGPAGPPPGAWTVAPHSGLGAWVDVYDWTREFAGVRPTVDVDDVDAMADAGVQTLYIQTAHHRSTARGVIERTRLEAIIQRAYDRGLHVVAWYLPTFVDPAADLRRLTASAALPVGGLAVDIESVEVADVAERNRRLLDLSARLRSELGPDKAIAAITLSAVHLQVVNPDFWPSYPWPELAATYDAILPMAYWSIRKAELHDGERYVGDNLDRIRASTGDDTIPIVPVGGIADGVTAADLRGMVRAIDDRGAPGGGLYDWATSTPEHWATLAPLRDRQVAPDQ